MRPPNFRDSLALLVLAIVAHFGGREISRRFDSDLAMAAAHVSWLVLPILLCVARRIDLVEGNYFRLPSIRDAGLTALLVLSAVWLLWGLIELQNWVFRPDYGGVEQEVRRIKERGAAEAVLLVAIWPAVREEMAFRGLALSGMARSGLPWAGLIFGSILFGVVHESTGRLVPTALLGMVFGLATLCTRSVLSGMLAHALNNGIAMYVSPPSPLPWPVLAVAAVVAALSAALLLERRRVTPPASA
jgi:sodium transport system permease protein